MSLYLKSDGLYDFNMRTIGNIYSEHTFEKNSYHSLKVL